MVSNIKKEFANNVKSADWIDDDTKLHVLEKLAAMSSYVGYPDELLSDKKLEDYYKGVDNKSLHVESENLLKMGLSTRLFDYENAAKSLVLPVNQINWVKWGELAIYVGVLNDLKTNEIAMIGHTI
ncbi:hypothetical protein PPYR_08745 [Photinus pyralis]|uniref:Peptidase M13 N-terminal domain-containing protein n=1 Tax=Photinus pyralis TaxID=7054 RepID=A0A5N4AK70_PHOPY|nr:hypothetical protein PPYR_08745 [Photinus pyralis]